MLASELIKLLQEDIAQRDDRHVYTADYKCNPDRTCAIVEVTTLPYDGWGKPLLMLLNDRC